MTLSGFRVQLLVRRFQGRGDVEQKGRKRTRHSGAARDQNIVMALASQKGQQLRRSGAQPPLSAVAGDGIAYFLAGGEAGPQRPAAGLVCRRGAGFQCDRAFDTANAPRRPEEVGARFEAFHGERLFSRLARRGYQAESFLRPDERRRLRTLRPPTVAMRERKPWGGLGAR